MHKPQLEFMVRTQLTSSAMTWNEAVSFAKQNSEYGWRLPTSEELQAARKFRELDATFRSEYHWTSTVDSDNQVEAVEMNSKTWNVGHREKDDVQNVCLVREVAW